MTGECAWNICMIECKWVMGSSSYCHDCRRIRDMQPSSSNKIKRRAHAQLKALVRSYRLTFTARHPRRRREDGGGHDHGAAGGHQGRHGSLRMMCRCRSSLCFGTSNRDQQTRQACEWRVARAKAQTKARRNATMAEEAGEEAKPATTMAEETEEETKPVRSHVSLLLGRANCLRF